MKSHTPSAIAAAVLAAALAAAGPVAGAPSPRPPLRVGVTLHPYYSWTARVVAGTPAEVVPVLPGEVDAGSYQPRPDDIRKLADLDAIVVNGVGHDDFIFDMIKASGNEKLQVIRPNDGVPLIRAIRGGTINSHTFISFSNAIQQTYAIARALGRLRPELAARYRDNAVAYARRLREIKNHAAQRLAHARIDRVVTVHDGYSYLMQEFGIEIAGVVEPAHGLLPSARELGEMVALLKREKIRVVFSEASFPSDLLDVLRQEAGARVYIISHIATGPYSAEQFEQEMQKNVDSMVKALVTDAA